LAGLGFLLHRRLAALIAEVVLVDAILAEIFVAGLAFLERIALDL
jgi:hypothetical protein